MSEPLVRLSLLFLQMSLLAFGGANTILPELQRQGHGQVLSELVEAEARVRGMRRLVVNAHESAMGFYEKTGWHTESWDPSELFGIAAHCVQMSKSL